MSRTIAVLAVLLLAAPLAAKGLDARLSNYPYPHPVELFRFTAQAQPLEMAYMDVAPARPNGRTVVLLHGKNFCGAYWADTIAFLSEHGYRVVVPDQIGFGKSSKPRHFQFTLHELARHTLKLLDHLKLDRVSLVGHSMGGMLAARFALSYPDRLRSLALVNPIGLEDWKRQVAYRSVDEHHAAELQSTPDSIRGYMRENYFAGTWQPAYEKLVEVPIGWLEGADRDHIAWLSALTTDMCFTQPVVHEFQDLRIPTLLVIGTRDRTALGKAWAAPHVKPRLGDYRQLGRNAAAAIPHAKLVELDAGHLPQVERFETYKRSMLDFLRP